MDLAITSENPTCAICGAEHSQKKDFALIVCRQEALYFCDSHLDAVLEISEAIKRLIETAEHKKIVRLGVKINSLRPQLKLLRKEGC